MELIKQICSCYYMCADQKANEEGVLWRRRGDGSIGCIGRQSAEDGEEMKEGDMELGEVDRQREN